MSEDEDREEPVASEALLPEEIAATRLGAAILWAKSHPIKAALALAAVLLSMSASMFGVMLVSRRPEAKPKHTLDDAYAALDKGRWADARTLAVEHQADSPDDAGGGADFIRGAVSACEAEHGQSAEKDRHYLLAAKLLEEAKRRGFPPEREGEGEYLLAKSLYLSGQLAAGRPALRKALTAAPHHAAELRFLLADAIRCDAAPDLAAAEKENRAALAAADDPLLRRRAIVQQAQLLTARGKWAAAETALKSLGNAPDATAILVRAQIQLGEARAATGAQRQAAVKSKCEAALRLIEQTQQINPDDVDVTRQAMYLRGECLAEAGDAAKAIEQFLRVEQLFRRSPEGTASCLHSGELLATEQRNDEALRAYRRALTAVADAQPYRSPWITLADFRKRVLAYYQKSVDRRDFATAVALCRDLAGAFPPDKALELTAETYRTWGRLTLSQADQESSAKAEALRKEGRRRLRDAAAAYHNLAKQTHNSRRSPDLLWDSIQASLDGHDYQLSLAVLQEYLKNENCRRLPDAQVAVGDAQLALGQIEEAWKAYSECVRQHPQDASAFHARLGAARASLEKNEPKVAERYLRDNLNAELLTPASAEWRESLFDLGRLLYAEARYPEAAARLEEAAERYPDSPRAPESIFLAANSRRQIARDLQNSLAQVTVEHTRLERERQVQQAQEESLAAFRKARDSLQRAQQAHGLTESQESLLRNVYFAIADNLADAGQYDEAIAAYQAAVRRYEDSPEALEAYSQIVYLQRRMNRPAEARGAIEQAKLMLRRLRPDAPFMQTTTRDRQQWQTHFDRLKDAG